MKPSNHHTTHNPYSTLVPHLQNLHLPPKPPNKNTGTHSFMDHPPFCLIRLLYISCNITSISVIITSRDQVRSSFSFSYSPSTTVLRAFDQSTYRGQPRCILYQHACAGNQFQHIFFPDCSGPPGLTYLQMM